MGVEIRELPNQKEIHLVKWMDGTIINYSDELNIPKKRKMEIEWNRLGANLLQSGFEAIRF